MSCAIAEARPSMSARPFLRVLSTVVGVVLALALAACGDDPKAGAEKAAKEWLDALNANNLSAAMELSTEPTKALLQMAAGFGEDMSIGEYKIEAVNMSGDNAAEVIVSNPDEPDNLMLDLVRIDGKWKVGVRK